MQLKTISTDAGRRSSGIVDTNDCTIRALAISANIPYTHAHKIGTEAGRKNGRGFHPARLLKVAKKEYGITYSEIH
jgi:hypothetical protein